MIGDDETNDILGAQDFGLTTIKKVNRTSGASNADIIFDNFNHLAQYYNLL